MSTEHQADERVVLIQAMIALAHSDGDFAGVERQRIERLIAFLGFEPPALARVEALLDAAPPPGLPHPADLPDYEVRRYVFQQALILAYEDGVVMEAEREHLGRLAAALELAPDDVEVAWARAAEMCDG